jgi:Mg2+ and Co2+ transporter CorA
MAFTVKENPLSCDIAPLDNQVKKSDDPLPLGNLIHIFCGKRGSGKSTILLNLLKRKTSPYHKSFDNIYLVSPTANRDEKFDKLVEELIEDDKFYDKLDDTVIDKIIEKVTSFNDEYKKEHPKKQPRNLLILDDCIHMLPTSTQHSSINQIFTNGRHMKLSIFLCTQQLTKLNRLIRTNADLLTFFPTDNKKEFETLSDEWSIEPKLLRDIYEFAIDGNNSFLHISFCGRKPMFFKKFDRIVIE